MFNTPEGARFLRFGTAAMILLVVFLAVQSVYTLRATSYVGKNTPVQNIISVNGKGEVFATPDIATFSFGAEATAKTVAEAQTTVTTKINKALDMIKAAGVEDKDIKTVNYSINPHYEYTQTICTTYSCPPSQSRLTGYDVNQMVEVKVRDTAKAGSILSGLGTVGVTNVSGLTFTIDDEDTQIAKAREMAIADARSKAKELAKNLGVRLGDVVSFNDYGYPMPYYKTMSAVGMGGDMMEQAANPRIPTGESNIVSNVTITYEIR